MDDDKDKSIFEKTIEAVKDAATIASEAVHNAMEPEPIKPGDEVIVMPMTATGFMGETMLPPFVVVPRKKKTSREKTSKATAKKTAKKSVKKAAKKKGAKSAVKKSKKKTVGKPPKKSKGGSAVKKKTKKVAKKKKAKRSQR